MSLPTRHALLPGEDDVATAEQLKALLRSHASGDEERFYNVAMQVAARAARAGQSNVGRDLKELIDELRAGEQGRPTPVVRPRGDLAGLLTAAYPKVSLSDMVLSDEVAQSLRRLIAEQRNRDTLAHRGFRPLRKALFVGPPGTGKTMAAAALASELSVPLFTSRLEGVITKFMGETASKLRLIFDALEQTRGLYFFDEVDAVAGNRASGNDVGEIRRVLNSFLQFLEGDESDSLIVAATNHPQLLDPAIFRRFETVVHFELPGDEDIVRVIKGRLSRMKTHVDWQEVSTIADGLSHSEISLASDQAAKDVLLAGGSTVSTEALTAALVERQRRH